jgi:hypothetical protein
MTTYWHLLIWFRLLKNCAARQHTAKAVLAVGLRQEAAASAFPDRNDGQHSFSAAYQCS